MRKIAAVFVILTLFITVFVSCDKDDEDETTLPPLTGATTTAPTSASNPVSTTDANANATYILTTSPDKTVPWGETTRFSTTSPSSTDPSSIVIQIPSDENTNPVTPNYSVAPTTKPTTTKPTVTTTTTTKPTTTKPTTTKPVVPKPVDVDTEGAKSFNGDGTELIIDISSSGWSSEFVSNTQYLPVYIDGSNAGKNVKCTLDGTLKDGNYEIYVDISGLSLSPDAEISISFPEGFIQTKAGTQYSKPFEIYAEY